MQNRFIVYCLQRITKFTSEYIFKALREHKIEYAAKRRTYFGGVLCVVCCVCLHNKSACYTNFLLT